MSTDSNQYDVLASPVEGKQQHADTRGRKDDMKEAAHQARTGLKAKAADLQEQVVASVASGIEFAKGKAGLAGKPTEDIVAEAADAAKGEWETVQRKGKAQAKKVEDAIDEKLTPAQKAQLKKGIKGAQRGATQAKQQADSWSTSLVSQTLAGPQLRPVKNFILKNNLSLPAVILGAMLSLWLGLTLIRWITSVTTPAVPEFDIHSKDASMAWLKYHAGEYKDKALDARESLTGRAAAFLANHEFDKIKNTAQDWTDIGVKRLGLQEPTWGEWAFARLTGRPATLQEKALSVLTLAKDGINRVDLKTGGLFDKIKATLTPSTHEPTLQEKAAAAYADIKASIPGRTAEPTYLESVKDSLKDSIDSIKAHIPGTEAAREAAEAARLKAYAATHPSTLDQIKSGATYVKNRIVHGSQEAAHIAQDRANELADKAKYKVGL